MNSNTAFTKTLLCLIATVSAAQATPLILGDTSGATRGQDAIDIQTVRADQSQVTSGDGAISLGSYNKTQTGLSIAIGTSNEIQSEESFAFGSDNTLLAGGGASYVAGIGNTIAANVNDGFALGHDNTVTASNAVAIGFNITNATASSMMIGPSDASKITILSSGQVGIGTGSTAPTAKLDVNGDAKIATSLTIGDTTTQTGNLVVHGLATKLRVAQQGDISMGTFTTQPTL